MKLLVKACKLESLIYGQFGNPICICVHQSCVGRS